MVSIPLGNDKGVKLVITETGTLRQASPGGKKFQSDVQSLQQKTISLNRNILDHYC